MKRYWIMFCIAVFLILLDQGTKLLISNFFVYDAEALLLVKGTPHIHPIVNAEDYDWFIAQAVAAGTGLLPWKLLKIGGDLLRGVPVLLVLWLSWKLSTMAELNPHTRLISGMAVFCGAGVVCSTLDRLFWQGTQDFICFAWGDVTELGQAIVRHKSFDLKDLYLVALTALVFLYFIWVIVDWMRFARDEKRAKQFVQTLKIKVKQLFHKN